MNLNDDAAITSLSLGLVATQREELVAWWATVAQSEQDDLNELTHNADLPWPFEYLEISTGKPHDDMVNDLYEYLVNHELKGFVPFSRTVSRDGYCGYFTGNVLSIPLCAPDWPPYPDSLHYKPWKPRGKLTHADLGFV